MNDHTGCVIIFGLFVLVNIINFFCTCSKQEIADKGASFINAIFMFVSCFRIKAKDSDNKFVRIGGSIGIFIALIALLGTIIGSFKALVVIGSIGFMVFCIIIGLLIYDSENFIISQLRDNRDAPFGRPFFHVCTGTSPRHSSRRRKHREAGGFSCSQERTVTPKNERSCHTKEELHRATKHKAKAYNGIRM